MMEYTRPPLYGRRLTPRRETHALDCDCGVCTPDVPQVEPWGAEKRTYTRGVPPGVMPPEVREGDHVWVEEGTFKGCILDLVKIERTQTVIHGKEIVRYVCRRTTAPYEVRTRRVSLYRRRA